MTENAAGVAGQELDQRTEDLLEALRDVVDPELGVNVVDLGLVYGVTVGEDRVATIDMTLTSAACPLTDVIGPDRRRPGGPGQRFPDQLGLAAAVGP
jgi:metal-sulfur cluster biosynthetic enzyme